MALGDIMRENDKIAAIRRCYVFSDVSEQSLAAMASTSDILYYPAGTPLFMAGDPPDGLRVVLSGLVRIWISDPEARELTLSLMEPGDPFGEIALLDGLPRSANATVVEAGECLLMPADALERAMDIDPSLARHLVGVLCEMLRRNTEALGAFAFLGLGGRLAQKIHDLALDHAVSDGAGVRFKRNFSQTDLARMLGVSREAVNKRLSALSHDGLISLDGGVLSVPDLSALAARARSETGMSMR
ncbi:MAG: Crp/Fnr family transcriptional regulator [Pseudomonadota bacterium]